MKLYKKILLVAAVAFIVIQFIQPARNTGDQLLPADLTKVVNVPPKVLAILKNSCYDCHSNNTRYPWYVYIQPVAWFMESHIKEGKENLNFSVFDNYSKRKQANKLREIAKTTTDGSMPISSYMLMHTNAKLSDQDKKLITDWVAKTRDSLTMKN